MSNPSLKSDIDATAEEKVRALVLRMAGRRLPGERDLASQLQISRPRLRTILGSLRLEGLIEQRIGSGTYALAPDMTRLRRVAILIDERLKLGADPFVSSLFECLQDSIQAEGARCTIERIGEDDDTHRLEDGAITLGLAGRRVVEDPSPGSPPVVGLLLSAATRPRRRASVFALDDEQAGADAAEYLIHKGCRQIVFAGRHDIPSSEERWTGCRAYCAASGVEPTFVNSRLSYMGGLKLGMEWDLPGERAGVIVTNDWLAVGLRAGLRRHESGAGNAPMIVSFDGLPIVSDKSLGIRSLAVPIQAIARDAVAELRRLSGSPVSAGRLVRYPLAWLDDDSEPPDARDILTSSA